MATNLSLTLGGTFSVSGGSAATYSVLYGQTSADSPAVWQDRTNTALRPGLWPEVSVSVRQATAISPYRVRGKVTRPKVDVLTNPDFPMVVATGFSDIQTVIPPQMTPAERIALYDATVAFVMSPTYKAIFTTLVPVI